MTLTLTRPDSVTGQRASYRCGSCGRAVTAPARCRTCLPYVGVSIVGCLDCRRARTFATESADRVARQHALVRAHRTWVVFDQALLVRIRLVPGPESL